MEQKRYLLTSVMKGLNNYIEKNYDWLKEKYIRGGYDGKMIFSVFCNQMFEKSYLEFEHKKIQEQFDHSDSF